MNTKQIVAIVAVIVVVVGGTVAAVIASTGNHESSKLDKVGRVHIYGNADNNDYLNNDDLNMIKDIADGKRNWNKTGNPYADANYDGKVDQADVELVQKFINKESATMYFLSAEGEVDKISYPLQRSVAATHLYSIDACIVLGLYESVKGLTNNIFTQTNWLDKDKYPATHDFVNVGTPKTDPEQFLNSGIKTILTHSRMDLSKLEDAIEKGNLDINIVQMNLSMYYPDGPDRSGCILMLGIMFQAEEAAEKYVKYMDKVLDYVQKPTLTRMTCLCTLFPNESLVQLDVTYADGEMYGELYTLSLIKIADMYHPSSDIMYPEVEMEKVLTLNPDIIFYVNLNGTGDSVEKGQSEFNTNAAYFSKTDAYKNKMVIGINYYVLGSTGGIAQLPLICSYLWPDDFDEETGWKFLQDYYDQFTMYENPDVKSMAGAQVYHL